MQLNVYSSYNPMDNAHEVVVRYGDRTQVYVYSDEAFIGEFHATRSAMEQHASNDFRRRMEMEEAQEQPTIRVARPGHTGGETTVQPYMEEDVATEEVRPMDTLLNVPLRYRNLETIAQAEPLTAQRLDDMLGEIRHTPIFRDAPVGMPMAERREDASTRLVKVMMTLLYKKLILTSEQYKAIMDTLKPGNSVEETIFVMERINDGDF